MLKRVIISTENAGKVEAAKAAFSERASKAPDTSYDISTISVESGVSDTPLSDEEGLLGCKNRIEAAKLVEPDADIYVALEGILSKVGELWYVRGWTMLEDTVVHATVTASGASVQVPDKIAESISADAQFSDTVKAVYAVNETERATLRDIGANGVFSDGEYGRRNTFYDGVRICLAELNNDRNW